MIYGDDKKGFTLIEIIIVMAIMAILSTLAVSGYVQYRKATLLDLAVDNIDSQFNEMRSKALYGEIDVDRYSEIKEALETEDQEIADSNISARCYGIYFEKTVDTYIAKSFSQEFVGKKIWQGDKWKYNGCGEPNEEDMQVLEIDQQVIIENIENVNGDVFVRFIPPNAEIELSENLDEFKIHLGYENDDNSRYKRELTLWTRN